MTKVKNLIDLLKTLNPENIIVLGSREDKSGFKNHFTMCIETRIYEPNGTDTYYAICPDDFYSHDVVEIFRE